LYAGIGYGDCHNNIKCKDGVLLINGSDQIIACPHCGILAKYETIDSGNTGGAQRWTDGKTVFPVLPQPPSVVKCNACNKSYWLWEAKKIGTLSQWKKNNEQVDESWLAAKNIEELSAAEYNEAIDKGFARNKNQETFLSKLAWWKRNYAVRDNLPDQKASQAQITDSDIKNMEALHDLLKEEKDHRIQIVRAELLRHLGRFDEAKEILKSIKSSGMGWIASVINELCIRGMTELRNLNDPLKKSVIK
jgi:hypothetical protein